MAGSLPCRRLFLRSFPLTIRELSFIIRDSGPDGARFAMKINDIPPAGITIKIEDKLDLFDEGRSTTPFEANVTIKPQGPGIFHVTGRVNASAVLECSRCLKPFDFPVTDAAMDFELVPEGGIKTGAEHELGRGELDMEFYRGEELDPKEFIREQLLLAIPMVPVHSPLCKGLCPTCGADRNEQRCNCKQDALPEKENPFAALKQIIKPEKE
jgi:uncharacterized protein